MAHAYTPGLKVSERTLVRKERRLPIPGEALVSVGGRVASDQPVLRTKLPGRVHSVNVANILGIPPDDIETAMCCTVGEAVCKGQVLARGGGFFGLFKSTCQCAELGTIESVSRVTGQVLIRGEPLPVEVHAYLDGAVAEVVPGVAVVVEAMASLIQGIFGIGGETAGEVMMGVEGPDEPLDPRRIDERCRGKVVVGGSLITREGLERAAQVGARAVVVGGFNYQDLRDFLGRDLGVAITGSEEKGITLVVTEGFGRLRMAERTFALLARRAGEKASVNGATQIRAGVLRPEVVVPWRDGRGTVATAGLAMGGGLAVGSLIRVIREPHFGAIGRVVGLPSPLQALETEAAVRVLEVELGGGRRVILPRANVEMIEE